LHCNLQADGVSHLRLPYARKFKGTARLMPTDPATFVFEKAMINVVGSPPLLNMVGSVSRQL